MQAVSLNTTFSDGTEANGFLGTFILAAWLNGMQSAVNQMQSEFSALLADQSITQSGTVFTQLTLAIKKIAWGGSGSARPTTISGYGITDGVTTTQLNQAIANLVNSSPAALDTLAELATALGNDANFATTITNALALKAPLASPTFTGSINHDGRVAGSIVTPAALDIDCSLTNYFTKTISANSTFTFSNVPSGRCFSFTLELNHTGGTVTWPTSVKWPNDAAPVLSTGKTHLFMFVTDDGGARWRGASLPNYTT